MFHLGQMRRKLGQKTGLTRTPNPNPNPDPNPDPDPKLGQKTGLTRTPNPNPNCLSSLASAGNSFSALEVLIYWQP